MGTRTRRIERIPDELVRDLRALERLTARDKASGLERLREKFPSWRIEIDQVGADFSLLQYVVGQRFANVQLDLKSPDIDGGTTASRLATVGRRDRTTKTEDVNEAAPSTAPGMRRSDRGTQVLTDLEGRREGLDAMLASGKLRLENGRLELVNPTDKLLFGGDMTDRGPHSIRMMELITDLKMRHPEQVKLIWGNRDLKTLGLLRDLPNLERTIDTEYNDWLLNRYKDEVPTSGQQRTDFFQVHNTVENRVEHWLDNHSARRALEFHRAEMEEIKGSPVARFEAAEDYIRRSMPGGEFFEYLKLGQIGYIEGNVL